MVAVLLGPISELVLTALSAACHGAEKPAEAGCRLKSPLHQACQTG